MLVGIPMIGMMPMRSAVAGNVSNVGDVCDVDGSGVDDAEMAVSVIAIT